jgi:glycosyltransferase involved in cell wall biosynthesis
LAYSCSDFASDLLLGRRMRDQGIADRWIGALYLFVPNPLFGYANAFTRRLHLPPDPKNALYYAYQRAYVLPLVLEADGVLITNDSDAVEFTTHGYEARRLHAVYGGINFDQVPSGEPESFDRDAIFVGRLHPMKGLAELLNVWRLVVDRKPSAKLAIVGVGDASYERDLRRLAESLGIQPSLEWLGYVEGPEKFKLLARSRVFLHTSIYDNSGMAAAEALACGTPAVAFDLPPLRIAYPSGVLKARIGDNGDFAAKTLSLINDDAERAALSVAARETASNWEWGRRVSAATDFFEKIASYASLSSRRARLSR